MLIQLRRVVRDVFPRPLERDGVRDVNEMTEATAGLDLSTPQDPAGTKAAAVANKARGFSADAQRITPDQ